MFSVLYLFTVCSLLAAAAAGIKIKKAPRFIGSFLIFTYLST